MFLRKGVEKIYSKFTGEHPCRSVISIQLPNNFIEIALWHGCSPVNLLHIFRIPFPRKTSGWLLLGVFKGALSGLRQVLATESLLKMMKNAFYFTSRQELVSFSRYLNFCLDFYRDI